MMAKLFNAPVACILASCIGMAACSNDSSNDGAVASAGSAGTQTTAGSAGFGVSGSGGTGATSAGGLSSGGTTSAGAGGTSATGGAGAGGIAGAAGTAGLAGASGAHAAGGAGGVGGVGGFGAVGGVGGIGGASGAAGAGGSSAECGMSGPCGADHVCDTTESPPACEPADTCGNGVVEANEECDDGNPLDGDACNHECKSTLVITAVTHVPYLDGEGLGCNEDGSGSPFDDLRRRDDVGAGLAAPINVNGLFAAFSASTGGVHFAGSCFLLDLGQAQSIGSVALRVRSVGPICNDNCAVTSSGCTDTVDLLVAHSLTDPPMPPVGVNPTGATGDPNWTHVRTTIFTGTNGGFGDESFDFGGAQARSILVCRGGAGGHRPNLLIDVAEVFPP